MTQQPKSIIMDNQNNTNSPLLRTLTLSFDLPIYARQIPNWRSAFIEMAGWQNDLFHNHNTTGIPKAQASSKHHFRYPLVQYRMRDGKAALFAINEGADALQQVLASSDWKLNWQGETRQLKVEDFRMQEHYFRMLPQPKKYKLFKWVALNSDNFSKWQNCRNAAERAMLLENILAANLIVLFASFGWRLPERMDVCLDRILHESRIVNKDVSMLAFDVAFSCNVLLPPLMAIGKSVSKGYGWQVPDGIPQITKRRQPKTDLMGSPKDTAR